MKRDRNHEGYHDPTAGRAIRRASKRRRVCQNCDTLTYRMEEVMSFWKVAQMLIRK